MKVVKILNIYSTGLDAHFAYRDHLDGLVAYNCPHTKNDLDGLVVAYSTKTTNVGEVRTKYKSINDVTLADIEPADEINFEGPVSKKLALEIFKENHHEQEGF